MRRTLFSSSLVASLLARGAVAADRVLEVTEVPIYESLAGCAQSAVKANVYYQTYDKCPDGVTELQSCICTKNGILPSVMAKISSSVSWSCGSAATDDQASATTVMSAYCNQDNMPTFQPPPTGIPHITEIPEMSALAPCASDVLTSVVKWLTYGECPEDNGALATCACNKNQLSQMISKVIQTTVKSSCSGHYADVASASDFFGAFCNLANGTSAFPRPSNPPGDMTYYITDLPQFTGLAKCAASGLSYVIQRQTNSLCPSGPQALASCACLKEGMTKDMLSSITSSVKYECTGSEDINSAVSVYNYYCSAARSEVVASGVTASVAQEYPTGSPISGFQTGSFSPKETGAGGSGGSGGNGGSGSSGSTDGGEEEGKSKRPNYALIGGIAGGVAVLVLIGGYVVWFLVKKSKERKALAEQQQAAASRPPTAPDGKQELPADSVPIWKPPPASPASTMLKPDFSPRPETVSPASIHASAYPPPPHSAELHAPAHPPLPTASELHGQPTGAYPPVPTTAELQAYPAPPQTAELYGQAAAYQHPHRPELAGQGPMYPPNRPELQGHGTPPPNHGAYPPPPAPYSPAYRPELPGQYQYQQSPAPPPQAYNGYQGHASPVSPYSQTSPGSQYTQPSPASPYGQPVPGHAVHEMDSAYYQQPGQAR